ncbi:MAG: hypothetical protein ACRCZE_03250 [Candidatus Altimarinota bacterium]
MSQIIGKIFKVIGTVLLAALVMVGTFFYEGGVSQSEAVKNSHQVSLNFERQSSLTVSRDGAEVSLRNGVELLTGDVISSFELDNVILKYATDGQLRLAKNSRVLVNFVDEEKLEYVFIVESGGVWVNNLYSNANVNLLVKGAVIRPGQGVVYINAEEGKALVYSNTNNSMVYFVPVDYAVAGVLDRMDTRIINRLILPQGTQMTVFDSKIANNQQTIARLLYSKLVKEFQYGVYDSAQLRRDLWLNKNIEKDQLLALEVKNVRLADIRSRGIKYNDLNSPFYQLERNMRNFNNSLTFSDDKKAERELEHLYDLLYDSQYLFDIGNAQAALLRLNEFSRGSKALLANASAKIEEDFSSKVQQEYDYLSFLNPSENLYALKLVLEQIYLDGIKGQPTEMEIRFEMLTNKLNRLNYYAFNNELKQIKVVFDEYVDSFRILFTEYKDALVDRNSLVQQQNQLLDNLFTQYSEFYALEFFVDKIYIENQYLSLLPEGNDKYEEIQTMVGQRISFLLRLENFFLEGEVSVLEAQNIVGLLIDKIDELQLPSSLQVAVAQLFNQRLEGFRDFYRFLNSPEYVNPGVREGTLRERFEEFKRDRAASGLQDDASVVELVKETGIVPDFQLGNIVPIEEENNNTVNEEEVNMNIDGDESTIINEVDQGTENGSTAEDKPKVPRVRTNN